MENINPESLAGTKKRQNKIWEYREMLQAWRRAGVGTWAGYILGFPTDTPESVARDIEIIKKELPIDILEFFFLTPLPGSEDHKKLYLNGAPLDPDLNKYDLEHACTTHPRMSKQEWEGVYRDAWARYYTDAHVETILRRAVASPGMGVSKIRDGLIIFSGASRIEGVHPLQFGLGRRKVRTQRRHGMKIVNPLIFYPWRAYDFAKASVQWLSVSLRYSAILRRIKATPEAKSYVDEATRPVNHDGGAQDDFVQFYADKSRTLTAHRSAQGGRLLRLSKRHGNSANCSSGNFLKRSTCPAWAQDRTRTGGQSLSAAVIPIRHPRRAIAAKRTSNVSVSSSSSFTRKPLAIVLADADGNCHRQTERRLQHGHAVQYTVWLLEADSRSTP